MKATNLLHRAMRAVLYCRIATAIKMASKGGGMLLIVVFIVFLAAAGAIRTSSCPLAEFSGFYESPGPP
jgi:hypothetical protein